MQEHTNKEQDFSKARRTNGIQVVDTSRLAASGVDALREAQMNLVRAEQTLYNLVQASHAATGSQFGAGYGYPTPQAIQASYATPAYTPGFTPPSAFPTPAGLAFGMVPGFNPWNLAPQPVLSPLGQWTAGIPATPGSLHAAPGFTPSFAPNFAPNAFAPSAGAIGAKISSRTPACDVIDEGKQFVCQLELPGIEAGQVELLCFERTVAINAYREGEGDIANLVQSERGNAVQQRVIALPSQIQPGSAKATLANGILTVVLPKVHPTEGPRRIAVQG